MSQALIPSYKCTTGLIETTLAYFVENTPIDKSNWVLRWEMMSNDICHVTVYQPRKNIVIDWIVKGMDEAAAVTMFGIELGR